MEWTPVPRAHVSARQYSKLHEAYGFLYKYTRLREERNSIQM